MRTEQEGAYSACEMQGRLWGEATGGNVELRLGKKDRASGDIWIALEENHYQGICGILLCLRYWLCY